MRRTGDHAQAERSKRRAGERRGRLAEHGAALWLMLEGYRILERRSRSRLGEIDIIAVRGKRLAFVEVKQRATLAEAMDSVSNRQARRIAEAAEQWVWRHPRYRGHAIGLDTISMAPWRLPRHEKDALQL